MRTTLSPIPPPPPRHVIFFGETGSGKSSVINLLLEAPHAKVTNDTQPCTQTSARYETSLYDQKYILWDTRGLGDGRISSFIRAILRGSSEKDLKRFLKERHLRREIDLLVYCVQGSRATKALVKNYEKFCAISRRLAAPVAIVVTYLEKEKNMEDWWNRNDTALKSLNMNFDYHACITTLPGRYQTESKEKLIDLITRNYRWDVKDNGIYFGSPVQMSSRPATPQSEGWMIRNLFRSKHGSNIDYYPRRRIISRASTAAAASVHDSVYHSALQTPVSESPTPRGKPAFLSNPPNGTEHPGVSSPLQAPGETSSMESFPRSMFNDSSHTSNSQSFSEASTNPLTQFPGRQFTQVGATDLLSSLPIEDLTGRVRKIVEFSTQWGSFGDVWECNLTSGQSFLKVAVKAIRTTPEDLESHQKKLLKELKIWLELHHRNIVPLLGVVYNFGHLPSMVSRWFSNGSLSNYLRVHNNLDISERQRLLVDIASGLCYLHSRDIIHGDLHSGNVLIDDDGTACLMDFGLSLVDDFVRSSLKSSVQFQCGHVVFADPALVRQVFYSKDAIRPKKPCDIYSFGGLMLHVLSGKKPYDEIPSAAIFSTVVREERPQIPTNITPRDVSSIRRCWDRDMASRPSAESLSRMFSQPQSI